MLKLHYNYTLNIDDHSKRNLISIFLVPKPQRLPHSKDMTIHRTYVTPKKSYSKKIDNPRVTLMHNIQSRFCDPRTVPCEFSVHPSTFEPFQILTTLIYEYTG